MASIHQRSENTLRILIVDGLHSHGAHLPPGLLSTWLRGNRSCISGTRLGTPIAAVDQVEDFMLKRSMCVAAAFMAGLISLACSSSGLKGGGSSAGAGGAVKGGQAGSTTTTGTGGAIGTGGAWGVSSGGAGNGAAGTIGAGGFGGAGTAGASGNTGGTGGCSRIDCHMPVCAGEFQPNPDPCGCAVICVPNPDAGIAKDAGSPDSPICPGSMLPCVPPPETCPAGYQMISPPCGCGGCVPVDGGTSDAGKPDALVICNVMCPMIACTYGYLPNPEPCGCPKCAPTPDAGVVKNTQDAGTRTPLLHRAAGATCPTGRATGTGPFICGCISVTNPHNCPCPGANCMYDADCTSGVSGRCLAPQPLPPGAQCSYDECFSDADCPANTPCDCRDSAASSTPNSCLTGSDCRVDSDCGAGNYCSPSPGLAAAYHCHTSNDTCVDDSDCRQPEYCAFNEQNGYWSCAVLLPP
jgi:hypothetical protein